MVIIPDRIKINGRIIRIVAISYVSLLRFYLFGDPFFLATDQEISISLWLVIRYKLAQAIVLKVFSLLIFFSVLTQKLSVYNENKYNIYIRD